MGISPIGRTQARPRRRCAGGGAAYAGGASRACGTCVSACTPGRRLSPEAAMNGGYAPHALGTDSIEITFRPMTIRSLYRCVLDMPRLLR